MEEKEPLNNDKIVKIRDKYVPKVWNIQLKNISCKTSTLKNIEIKLFFLNFPN